MLVHKDKFCCPNCFKLDHQEIIFLGSEFSYQCKHCLSVHCFLENLYWDFTQNFLEHGCGDNKWKINRYAGTINQNKEWIGEDMMPPIFAGDFVGQSIQKARNFFKEILTKDDKEKTNITITKTSDKTKNGLFYIANALCSSHFQECLRSVVRMKEYTLKPESKHSYNILILDEKTKFCIEPVDKINGLDEIWYLDWSIKSIWSYVMDHIDDFKDSLFLSNTINEKLKNLHGESRVISKCCSPTIYGIQPIKDILYTNKNELKDIDGNLLNKKYIAILIHQDNNQRAGFEDIQQIETLYDLIKSQSYEPIIIACTNFEENIVKKIKYKRALIVKKIEDQIIFYNNYCRAVVGTNCSGCNFPCLYNLPLFTLAKNRSFPDDFYSMGRMLSPYDCNFLLNGDLTKPNTVLEIKTKQDEPTNILNHKQEFLNWINKI